MLRTLSPIKPSDDEADGFGSTPPPKRVKIENDFEENEKRSNKRLKDVEISVPIVYGTMAFWLGRKATEFHHLNLYSEDESGLMSTKKPVVVESYDEIVFPNLSEVFFTRVRNHPAVIVPKLPCSLLLLACLQVKILAPFEHANERKIGDTKDNLLSQWFMNFSDADELLKLAAARQQDIWARVIKGERRIEAQKPVEPQARDVRYENLMRRARSMRRVRHPRRDAVRAPQYLESRGAEQSYIGKLRRQLSVIEGLPQPLEPACG
ncbi:YEATS family protein [Actinidia rufa]|uniref:YEATS family protein n=1 Tax=Actinidia rufa TaxID=165716 RepID=A0A7J0EN24_9ERIC|nr:YEATS family protein [Actinidia rufa]